MLRGLALAQFLLIALGSMILIILMKTHTDQIGFAHELRSFLGSYKAIWLVLIPVIWVVFAGMIQMVLPGEKAFGAVKWSGIILVVGILATYGWLIFNF